MYKTASYPLQRNRGYYRHRCQTSLNDTDTVLSSLSPEIRVNLMSFDKRSVGRQAGRVFYNLLSLCDALMHHTASMITAVPQLAVATCHPALRLSKLLYSGWYETTTVRNRGNCGRRQQLCHHQHSDGCRLFQVLTVLLLLLLLLHNGKKT